MNKTTPPNPSISCARRGIFPILWLGFFCCLCSEARAEDPWRNPLRDRADAIASGSLEDASEEIWERMSRNCDPVFLDALESRLRFLVVNPSEVCCEGSPDRPISTAFVEVGEGLRALIPCRPDTALSLAEEISLNPRFPIAVRREALNTVVCQGWSFISGKELMDLCFRTAVDSRARAEGEYYSLDLTWEATRLALGGGELKEPLPVGPAYDLTLVLRILEILLADFRIRGAAARVEGVLYMGILEPEKVRPSWKLEVKEYISDAPPADPTRRWAEKMILELGWN